MPSHGSDGGCCGGRWALCGRRCELLGRDCGSLMRAISPGTGSDRVLRECRVMDDAQVAVSGCRSDWWLAKTDSTARQRNRDSTRLITFSRLVVSSGAVLFSPRVVSLSRWVLGQPCEAGRTGICRARKRWSVNYNETAVGFDVLSGQPRPSGEANMATIPPTSAGSAMRPSTVSFTTPAISVASRRVSAFASVAIQLGRR